ncbi:MAG: HAD family hydrolase [Eubacteriales bacterium]|nr:HAD family hydrolase [Eubacteriales bacterium]
MRKPKMILFDYGQTLLDEEHFDGIKGTLAVLEKCVKNPNNITAEEIQSFANELNKDFGRYDPKNSHLCQFEIHNHSFQNYLYDYFKLERIVPPIVLETIFWNAASPAKPTINIIPFLDYLYSENIRTGVISNISFSGDALKNRINEFLPNNRFEFIIATSEYIFRKPQKRIFELALRKSNCYADEVWYCGDNAICDVDGAKSAGLTPVWYKGAHENYSNIPQKESIVIHDWLELIGILDGTTMM